MQPLVCPCGCGLQLSHVSRTQWLSPDVCLSGQRLLLVDEVDDSRKTLAFAVDEMIRWVQGVP